MSIRMPAVFLPLFLLMPLAAAAATEATPASAAPPPVPAASAGAPAADAAPAAVFPRLMTVQEASQTPEQKVEQARRAQSRALGERLLQTARSLRNMGVLTLSALLGLLGSAVVGGLIALAVHTLRERRAAGR